MKLSTRARYGLRALIELAGHYGDGATNMQAIADRQALSRKYLDTLFNSLKVAGLVMSRRGVGGGWELTRHPDKIGVGEILLALEGSLGLVQCVDFPDTCQRNDCCVTRELYVELNQAIFEVLNQYSLSYLQLRQSKLDEHFPSGDEHFPSGDERGVLCMQDG